MRILTRYMIREMIGPTLLGFAFYTFIILMRQVFELAEVIIRRSLPLATVLELLAWSIPNIIVLTIPMSLLFGILIAVGRLSADSEIIAMRTAGIPTSAIYRPVFFFSLFFFVVNLYLMNFVLPLGNQRFQDLRAEASTSAIQRVVSPRVFFDDYENLVIYVNDVDEATGDWKGVFISDQTTAGEQRIHLAQSGGLSVVPEESQIWLDLIGAESHIFSPAKEERYDRMRNQLQRFLLIDRLNVSERPVTGIRALREMTAVELLEQLDTLSDPMDRRMAMVELHKKFSIPFACLAFGVIALPLGITNRRGGKSSGFTLSIGIILLYYILLNNGEDMARSGALNPALAIWAPNIVLLIAGMFLIRRASRDAGKAGAPSALVERVQGFARKLRRRRRDHRRRESSVIDDDGDTLPLLARLDIPFPNTIDRYLLKEFAKVLAFVLLSCAVLFVVVDYTELAGHIAQNQVPGSVVFAYYRYFLIQTFQWILPLSILLGTLITFGILSRNNEVTALKANGISLYRITVPIVVVAALTSGVSYLLTDFVMPHANERVVRLKDQIKGRQTARAFSPEQRQWVFGEGRYIFNFLSFDRRQQTLSQVQVYELHPTSFRLARRVYADQARWDGTGWWFVNGWMRSFGDDGTSSYSPIRDPIRLHYPERPEYFALEAKSPQAMTYAELRRHIQDLRRSGYAADPLLVKLYEKTSWPFISLVMALIALPFAFRIGKKGALYGVGIALFLAFTYWIIFGIFTKFGEVGNLPAVLSAWSANILFAIAAVYMFLHVET
jgi:LPS export ABC transporter permease LptG/LPS export ABC transporter permease LptF